MRSPEQIRKEVTEYAGSIDPARLKTIPPGLKGKMVSMLNSVFSCNENRRIVIGWMFTGSFANPVSTSDLTEAQIAGLLHWLQPEHQKTGWVHATMFKQEAALVYAYIAKEHVKTATWKAPGGNKMKLSPALLSAIGAK